jgi:hypothetical protein
MTRPTRSEAKAERLARKNATPHPGWSILLGMLGMLAATVAFYIGADTDTARDFAAIPGVIVGLPAGLLAGELLAMRGR